MNSKRNYINRTSSAATSVLDDSFTLPTDVGAERSLIATLLDQPRLMPDALELLGGGQVLTHEAYRILLSVLTGLYDEGRPVKLATVLQQLIATGQKGKIIEYGINITTLPAEAKGADFSDTCIHLRGLWVKRMALESASRIVASVQSNESVAQVVDAMTHAGESVSAGLSIGSDPTLADVIRESVGALEDAMKKEGGLTGVNTGLGKLNKHLGGWQDSDIIMIAGRPGMGKSVAGVYHAIAAARTGVPVAFLSLEMPAKSLMNRVIACETGIEYSRIKRGKVSQDEFARIQKAIGQIEKLPIHFYDDANKDVNDLSYKLLHWKKRHGIGLVIIDYVQKLTDRTVKGGGEYETLTSISNKVMNLRKRLNCPIIELTQLNRQVEAKGGSKRAGMADIRGSGQFEQDATVIITLYRDDYYKEKTAREAADAGGDYIEPVFDNSLEYAIIKNRDGEPATAVLWADMATNRMADDKPSQAHYPATNLENWHKPTNDVNF